MSENKPFSKWVPAPGGGMMHVYYDPYLDGPGDPDRDPHPDPHPDPDPMAESNDDQFLVEEYNPLTGETTSHFIFPEWLDQ